MGANTERESKPNTKFLSLIFFFFQLLDVMVWCRCCCGLGRQEL